MVALFMLLLLMLMSTAASAGALLSGEVGRTVVDAMILMFPVALIASIAAVAKDRTTFALGLVYGFFMLYAMVSLGLMDYFVNAVKSSWVASFVDVTSIAVTQGLKYFFSWVYGTVFSYIDKKLLEKRR